MKCSIMHLGVFSIKKGEGKNCVGLLSSEEHLDASYLHVQL